MTLGEHPWTEEIVRLFDDLEDAIIAVPEADSSETLASEIARNIALTWFNPRERRSRAFEASCLESCPCGLLDLSHAGRIRCMRQGEGMAMSRVKKELPYSAGPVPGLKDEQNIYRGGLRLASFVEGKFAARLVSLMNATHVWLGANDDRGLNVLLDAARDFAELEP
jgi:hypothetical protein